MLALVLSVSVKCQYCVFVSEFTRSTSHASARVKFESRAKSEPGSNFYFSLFFLLLLMSSGCYSLLYYDVLVVIGKEK